MDRSRIGRELAGPLQVEVAGIQVVAFFRSELNSQHHQNPLVDASHVTPLIGLWGGLTEISNQSVGYGVP